LLPLFIPAGIHLLVVTACRGPAVFSCFTVYIASLRLSATLGTYLLSACFVLACCKITRRFTLLRATVRKP